MSDAKPEEIEANLAEMTNNEGYRDIKSVVASTGAVYLYSEPYVPLYPPLYFYAASLIIKLLLLLDSEKERKQIIFDSIRDINRLFSAVYLIHHITPIKERQSDRADKDLEELVFSIDFLKELQALCVDKMKKRAENNELLDIPHPGLLLSKWHDWGDKADVDEAVQRLSDTDQGLIALLAGFAGERSGPRGTRALVNREWFSEFVDIKSFTAEVQNIDRNKLDTANQELVNSFLKGEDRFD